MRKLTVNVWAQGRGYGPGFGDLQPSEEVAAELPDRVFGDAPASEPAPKADPPVEGDGLDGLTKAQLVDVAEVESVRLSGRQSKANIIAAIRAAR